MFPSFDFLQMLYLEILRTLRQEKNMLPLKEEMKKTVRMTQEREEEMNLREKANEVNIFLILNLFANTQSPML